MSNLSSGGLSRVLTYIKTYITGLLSSKANSSHTHTKSEITDFPAYGTTAGTICQGNDSRLSDARTPNFANNTWYSVGDDVAIGDHNIGGGLGVCGLNANTRIDFCQYNNAGNYKSITFDGTTLYMNGNCDYATSAGSAGSVAWSSVSSRPYMVDNISYKFIDSNYSTQYRTQTKGNTSANAYISVIRTDGAASKCPQYGSGIASGMSDTHFYIYCSYYAAEAYIGGGNADKLNWISRINVEDNTYLNGYKIYVG